ncbi:MAG: hypothetical protein ACK5ML_14565 [Lachnospiraceae bacterium]
MKKNLILLILLTMLVSLCACESQVTPSASEVTELSSTNTVTSEKESEEISEYESETLDLEIADTSTLEKQAGDVVIEITPPEGWVSVEGSTVPVQYLKNTTSFIVKQELYSSATLDEVVQEASGIFKNSFDDFEVIGESEPSTVDEKDARKLIFTCTVSGMKMKFIYVFLFAADQTYIITFGGLEDTFDTLADDYETILNNIRFTTP